MMMKKSWFWVGIIAIALKLTIFAADNAVKIPAVLTEPKTLVKQKGHIQGACATNEALYLSCVNGIFKIGWDGKLIKHVSTEVHTGDICYHNGTIYSAVAFKNPKNPPFSGKIVAFDTDLNVKTEYNLTRPIDGITVCGDYFYFGAGPNEIKSHRGCGFGKAPLSNPTQAEFSSLDPGFNIFYGTQNIATWNGKLFITFYSVSKKEESIICDTNGNVLKKLSFRAAQGFGEVPPRFAGDLPRYFKIVPLVNWRKISKKNPMRVRVDFYEFDGEKMIKISD